MRSIALIPLVALAVAAQAQTSARLPLLGPPSPIDFHVRDVKWHPKGEALLYSRKVGDGSGVGAYLVGQDQGKVLVHLESNDVYELEWMPGTNQAVAIVYRHDSVDSVQQRRVQVYLLNAETQESQLLFNRTFPLSDKVEMNVDCSPKLAHAIFRLYAGTMPDGKSRKLQHFILKTGGKALEPCPDLDEAEAKGLSGPSWSLDGTAVYSPLNLDNLSLVPSTSRATISRAGVSLQGQANEREREVVLRAIEVQSVAAERASLTLKLSDANNVSFRWIAHRPAPPVGASVMELMPQNGTLRSVRFRGAWVEPNLAPPTIRPQDHQIMVEFGRSKSQSKTIWLTSASKSAEQGVLISSNATQAWLSPTSKSVAYLTDGALFLRKIIQ